MRSGPCVLAIDLGTSGPKAAVVSPEGRTLGAARAPVETLLLPDGGAEQDPEAVWRAVKSACTQALRASGAAPREVLALICCSQYSSIVPVDRDGRATMNMILWLDRRGTKDRLRRLPKYPKGTDSPLAMLRWLRVHGLPPVDGGMSLSHMRYLKFARPEVYARTATFLEPMDYVAMRFSGRAAANPCTALMMLLTDNRRPGLARYDPQLVRYSRIDADRLPELLPADAILGTVLPEVAEELGLTTATKVVTGTNDTQAGAIATGAFRGAHAGISVGSTSVMITHVGFKRTDARHALLSMPSPVPDTYFVMAENGVGGAGIEHVLDKLLCADTAAAERFELLQRALAETPPGAAGAMFLPWLAGALAPAADPRMRGGFLNIGLEHTRSHLLRAALEGVAMNLRWLRRPLEKFAGRELSHFVFYGGGARSDGWSQIMADVLGSPVHQMQDPQHATCVGAGLLACERLGLTGFDEICRRMAVRRIYDPAPATRGVYDAMSVQFVRAFERVRPICRALGAAAPALRQQEN